MKRWLLQSAVWITLSGTLVACGKTADVLTSRPDAGRSGEDASAGGSTSKGSGGSTGGSIDRADAHAVSNEAGADASTTLLPDGGTILDPHAAERRSLADQFCALLDKYPCLNALSDNGLHVQGTGPQPTQAQRVQACSNQLNLEGFNDPASLGPETPTACWEDWVAVMKCRIAEPHQCPCSVSGCNLYEPGLPPTTGLPCGYDAYMACVRKHDAWSSETVTGSRFSCSYQQPPDRTSCQIECGPDLLTRAYEGTCSGPPGGPYYCNTTLNGGSLVDDATGAAGQFYADDCRSVAQAMANGGDGVSAVDCCFTWHAPDAGPALAEGNVSDAPGPHCSCTADPTKVGFATCAAAAAAGNGEVVDLCPQYEPPPNAGFPGQ